MPDRLTLILVDSSRNFHEKVAQFMSQVFLCEVDTLKKVDFEEVFALGSKHGPQSSLHTFLTWLWNVAGYGSSEDHSSQCLDLRLGIGVDDD